MINSLDVYLYDEHVATITRQGDNLTLRYLPGYIARDQPVPISVQLPVVASAASGTTIRRFLENLLPDRPDVRTKWARDAKLSSDSAFDLLTVYGADVAGALEFYPTGTARRTVSDLLPITDEAIAARIRQIRADDSDWLQQRAVEEGFSLGGAQGKFALAHRDGQWYEPSGQHPSTHIFKPGVHTLPGSDVTEHITLQVARQCGLTVATTAVGVFEGEHVLIVERFDRLQEGNRYRRIHQEDLAQATGTSFLNKYERDGGPGYRDLFTLFDRELASGDARAAKRRFAECLVFSWIIGHNDGHTKNYSLSHLPGATVLSPFYDLNSSLPFELPSTVRAADYRAFDGVKLAFSINGSAAIGGIGPGSLRVLEHDAQLDAGHLADFAITVAATLQPVVANVIGALPVQLQQIEAVTLYPFATYSQTLRVRDLFLA